MIRKAFKLKKVHKFIIDLILMFNVWSIFDIHCPNCGMTLADRPNND